MQDLGGAHQRFYGLPKLLDVPDGGRLFVRDDGRRLVNRRIRRDRTFSATLLLAVAPARTTGNKRLRDVAGPRASKEPGVAAFVREVLEKAWAAT